MLLIQEELCSFLYYVSVSRAVEKLQSTLCFIFVSEMTSEMCRSGTLNPTQFKNQFKHVHCE